MKLRLLPAASADLEANLDYPAQHSPSGQSGYWASFAAGWSC